MTDPSQTRGRARPSRGRPEGARPLSRELARRARALEASLLGRPGNCGAGLRAYREALAEQLLPGLDEPGLADACAQTVAYGLLAARLAEPAAAAPDAFASLLRAHPLLEELVGGVLGGPEQVAAALEPIQSLLAGADLEAVLRDFSERSPDEDPVIHLYEQFLQDYDPAKRSHRGVFYTPRPVVSFIVRSVDRLLREELGLADGLADTSTWAEAAARRPGLRVPEGVAAGEPFVRVLDPAAGTGTFLVEIAAQVHRTLVAKWRDQGLGPGEIAERWNGYVPEHLLPRLHGFELLLAPYAVAHFKLDLELRKTGYRPSAPAHAPILLTSALSPALPGRGDERFPALQREASSVRGAKSQRAFTVVVGNPPYSNFGRANENDWIASLVRDFRAGLEGESKVNLYDDYIKFVRLAFHLRERAGAGVIGLVTNRGFLDGATQRSMRRFLLGVSPRVRVLDLYRGIFDAAPGDENVFAITTGVAVSLWSGTSGEKPQVRFGRLVGAFEEKASALSTTDPDALTPTFLRPEPPDHLLVPAAPAAPEYGRAPPIPSLFRQSTTGVQTNRDALCLGDEPAGLLARIRDFAQSPQGAARLAASLGVPTTDHWNPGSASQALAARGVDASRVHRYLYRPFDFRWIYYDEAIVHCPRRLVAGAVIGRRNPCLLVSRGVDDPSGGVAFVTTFAADKRALNSARGEAKVFPILGEGGGPPPASNLELPAEWSVLAGPGPGADLRLLAAAYAILNAPSYLRRNAEALRLDYPRLPVPSSRDLFDKLAALGQELIDLHLLESPRLDEPAPTFLGPADPAVGRIAWAEGGIWLDAPGPRGQRARPGSIGFAGIPEPVWLHRIGGHQVCEKWLRERKGRRLAAAEVEHYRRLLTAVAESIRLSAAIDLLIERHGGWESAFR